MPKKAHGMRLWSFAWRAAGGTIGLTTPLGLVSGAASTALIVLVSALLTDPARRTWGAASVFLVVAAVGAATRVAAQVLLIRASQRTMIALRARLCRGICWSTLERIESLGPARLLTALTDDIGVLADGVAGLPFLLVNAATVVGCLVYLAWLAPIVFVVTAGFLAFGLASYRLLERPALRALGQARTTQDTLFGQLRAMIEGVYVLLQNAERRRAFLNEELAPVAQELGTSMGQALGRFAVAGAWAQIILIALLGLVVFFIPGIASLAPAELTAVCLTVVYLVRPLDFVLSLWPSVARARVALANIDRLGLELPDEEPPAVGASAAGRSRLDLEGVCFDYGVARGEGSFSLGPVDLSLTGGRIVFVTGGNGSGKTTLAKLLTGLYAPTAGTIRIDGVPITEANREWHRRHWTTLLADAPLFRRLPAGAEAGAAQGLVARLGLAGLVATDGTRLEHGELSRGQKKRAALLLALLEDRPLYLFDEWAADQDPEFRRAFYEEILGDLKRRGKAIVVISHDERYYSVADERLALEEGRVRARD